MSKIYHVEMKESVGVQKHFYFGSQAAIYDVLSPAQLGISYKALTNKYNLLEKPYENKKCIIRMGELIRKKTERGPRPQQFFHF